MNLQDWHEWWKYFGISPVRHLLLLYWDPIGVYGTPEAADEYDRYGGSVGALLRQGTTVDEIAGYLASVEVERMGLAPSPRSRLAATRISEWFHDAMRAMDENPEHPVTASE